ncbi:MAG: sensor histidine kinase [Actinomycetota bacterium]|nr:sensor histidine kinase [Actinomycetota bacterium]
MRTRMRRLSSQIFVAQLVILTTTILIGFLLLITRERSHLDSQYQARAASIAKTTAQVPDIRKCMQREAPGCASTIQRLATDVTMTTDASYVVIIDMDRVRHSHPDPALIGQQVSEPIVVTDGRTHVGVDDGSTGRSANARAPLYGPDGRLVGEVSVGLQESSVSAALWQELPSYAAWLGIALGLGAIASWGLARRLKQRTFGLELDEISLLLQEREATLHGVREGVIAFDTLGRVSMVNDEAQRLLGLSVSAVGHLLPELLPPGPLRDALTGDDNTPDDLVLTDDYALVVNRMPVRLAGRSTGAVVTLRDRTELAALLRELDGERGLTDSLRAQQHEFANRMHTVAGLLELGETQEAMVYLTEIQGTAAEFDHTLRSHIAAPQIVGLILGKAAEANERGIQLEVSGDTWLGEAPDRLQLLTMVLGNLIDNAMDALTGRPTPRVIVVLIVEDDDTVVVTVSDNGPGIPPGLVPRIFLDGYSTKSSAGGRLRGLGLALVYRSVTKLGGSVAVTTGAAGVGATLTVTLPREQSTPRPLTAESGVRR